MLSIHTVGVDGLVTVTILRNPNGTQVNESTYDYPILSNVTLTCMVTSSNGSIPTMINYQWNTTECFTNTKHKNPTCFNTDRTGKGITVNNLLAEDAGTITCTVSIGDSSYTSKPLTLRVSGMHIVCLNVHVVMCIMQWWILLGF